MEEVMLGNLKMRHDRLIESTAKIKEITDSLETGVKIDMLTAAHIALKSRLAQFTDQLNRCMVSLKKINVELFQNYNLDQIKAEDLLTEVEVIQKIYVAEKQENYKQARLPKLEMGKYDGDVLKWTSFWDRFAVNIHNRDLPEVEKLSYLIGSLEGLALQAVEGLEITHENYSIAINILSQRFGKRERVVDAHHEALQQLGKATDCASDCRKVLSTIDKHLRVLEAMGERVDASHLRVTISAKFPEKVIYQVSLITKNDPSINAMRQALDTVVSALEQAELLKTRQEKAETPADFQQASTSTLHVKERKRRFPEHDIKREQKRPKYSCIFCEGQHYSEACKKYKDSQERKMRLGNRCFICFTKGHRANQCIRRIKCFHCKQRHNRALCPARLRGRGECDSVMEISSMDIDVSRSEITSIHVINKCSFLQTAIATVEGKNKKSRNCRLLLDSGSQRSYLTHRMAKELGLKPEREDSLLIYTFGSVKPEEVISPSAEITVTTKRLTQRKIIVNIVPHITDRVPVANLNSSGLDVIADDNSLGQAVDLLIGNDLYFSFIRNNNIKIKDDLYWIDSDFGWLISGSTTKRTRGDGNILSVVTYCNCHDDNCPYFTEPDLPLRSIDVKFLWALESIGITDSPKVSNEEEAVKHFNDTVTYHENRYQVKWPWIQYPPELPTNYGLALGRLKGLLKRSDKDTLDSYDQILKEQLEAKIIEEVEPPSNNNLDHPIHYLAHHMIKQRGKGGRIVYDASAKLKGEKSLNECLYRGPSMLEDLTELLLNFRVGKIAITADVEKAFLQVGLQPEDRDVTRFLWVKDPTKEVSEDMHPEAGIPPPRQETDSLNEPSPECNEPSCDINVPLPSIDIVETPVNASSKRNAAVKAKEKIAEWTRHLLTIL